MVDRYLYGRIKMTDWQRLLKEDKARKKKEAEILKEWEG